LATKRNLRQVQSIESGGEVDRLIDEHGWHCCAISRRPIALTALRLTSAVTSARRVGGACQIAK
jgi:hypothetical protein